MFFVAAKVFWFFVQPLNLALFLLAAGLFASMWGRRRVAAAGAICGFLILALSAWTTVGALLLQPLEARYARPTHVVRVDGVVVLGGGLEGQINKARGGYELSRGGDRLIEAAVLARRFPNAKVVVSGGSGDLIMPGEGDGDTAPRLLTALGLAPERLIVENKSRDTYENAVFTKALMTPKPDETWLLVTSAFHMPRSIALFRKAGFEVLPWPTDYRTTGNATLGVFQDNVYDALDDTSTGLREWIGLFAYWLTGRIDSPFP